VTVYILFSDFFNIAQRSMHDIPVNFAQHVLKGAKSSDATFITDGSQD
jgi:hypothetical protein